MANIVIVAEKPSVGRAIAEAVGAKQKIQGYFMGNNYCVTWCYGHIVELAQPAAYGAVWADKKWDIETLPIIPTEWKWVVNESAKEQYKIVKTLICAPDTESVICATDADREGEGIFRRVYEHTSCKKPVRRLWTASLEAESILKCLKEAKPSSEYNGLADAAKGRALADWLVGMNGSRAYSSLYHGNYSVGRVQTPTLAMIVDRDRSIESFVPTPFAIVRLDLGGFTVRGERIDDIPKAQIVADEAVGEDAVCTDITVSEKSKKPPTLYSLTALQKDANTIFGLTAGETLDAAQKLYENKITSYPRTDSVHVTEAEKEVLERYLLGLTSSPLAKALSLTGSDINMNPSAVINDAKVEGHYALIPLKASLTLDLEKLGSAESKVLKLIVLRLVQALASAYRYEATKAMFVCNENNYQAYGQQIIDEGFRRYVINATDKTESNNEEQMLPEIEKGKGYRVLSAEAEQKKTEPQKRYTDDTLLAAIETCGKDIDDESLKQVMKGSGLGTSATRAGIIETIITRGYATREKRQIISTAKGRVLIDLVSSSIKSPELTARWETELADVEANKASLTGFVSGIEDYARNLVSEAKTGFNPAQIIDSRAEVGKCPICGQRVLEGQNAYNCESNHYTKDEASGKWELTQGCGFKVFKIIASKKLTTNQVATLLTKGKTALIKGFTSKAGKSFDAALKIEDGSVVFDFEKSEKKSTDKRIKQTIGRKL